MSTAYSNPSQQTDKCRSALQRNAAISDAPKLIGSTRVHTWEGLPMSQFVNAGFSLGLRGKTLSNSFSVLSSFAAVSARSNQSESSPERGFKLLTIQWRKDCGREPRVLSEDGWPSCVTGTGSEKRQAISFNGRAFFSIVWSLAWPFLWSLAAGVGHWSTIR